MTRNEFLVNLIVDVVDPFIHFDGALGDQKIVSFENTVAYELNQGHLLLESYKTDLNAELNDQILQVSLPH